MKDKCCTETLKFKGKTAVWFWLIFICGEVLILYELFRSLLIKHNTSGIIVLLISLSIYTLVFLPIVIRNYVLIEDGKIKLYFGFSKDAIEISGITEIKETYNPIASSAASLDRIIIKGRRQEMMVSVRDKQEFIKELRKRNEYITIQ